MTKFIDLFINWSLVGLIIFGILIFASTFESENEPSLNFMEEGTKGETVGRAFRGLQTNLGNQSEAAQSQRILFESENPTAGFGSLLLVSIVSAGKVFNGMIIGTFNILVILPATYLDVDPIVFSVIFTILIILILMTLWAVYKLGG